MAFQLPNLPSFQTNIPQADPLQTYGKMLQLKALQGQQQLLPGQLQLQQQQLQTSQLENQQRQMSLQSQQAMMTAIANGELDKYAGVETPDGMGFDAAGAYQHLVKSGVLPEQAQQWVGGFQGTAQKNSEIQKNLGAAQKDFLENRAKSHEQMAHDIADILGLPPEQQASALQTTKQEYLRHPLPGVDRNDLALFNQADTAHLPALAGQLKLNASMEDYLTQRSQKAAESEKAALAVAPPSPAQLSTFTGKTIPAFGALRPEQKNAFIAEAKTARTVDEFNKVVERADATDKAEQMHQDSLAQTAALKGQTFAQQGLVANDKTWTDPQHGYLQTLSQAKLGKAAIKAGAEGNGLLTSLEPTMAVLGMNSFAGVHRISPAEATAAGAPGGWAEQFTAWADKAASGKLSPQLAKEGNQLFDQLVDAKYQGSLQTSAMHAKGYNIPAANMPVMDREGNVTTLDKAPKATETKSVQSGPPAGATHIGVGSQDQKKHYLDAKGNDLGLAPP